MASSFPCRRYHASPTFLAHKAVGNKAVEHEAWIIQRGVLGIITVITWRLPLQHQPFLATHYLFPHIPHRPIAYKPPDRGRYYHTLEGDEDIIALKNFLKNN